MKKTLSKLLALLLTASLLLSGCSGASGEGGETEPPGESGSAQEESVESSSNEITDLVIPKLSTKGIRRVSWYRPLQRNGGPKMRA